MEFEIRFTKLASKDLKCIEKYIFDDNKEASKRVISHIIKEIEMLHSVPSLGRAGRVLRTRELIISKYPFIVPYMVKNEIVYILRVLHTAKRWEE